MGNVIDNLLKMKEISSLMVDLAYATLFFRDKELVGEVKDLHRKMQHLQKETLKFIFRVRGSDEERIAVTNMMEYIMDIANAAVNLTKLSENHITMIKHVLDRAKERLMIVEVNTKSKIMDRTLSESKIRTLTGAHIKRIKRGNTWIFDVVKETKIRAGDILVATGTKESADSLKKLVG